MNLVTLAQMLAASWKAEEAGTPIFNRVELRTALIASWNDMPQAIKALLHIRDQLLGDVIAEEAEIIDLAIASGMGEMFSLLDALDRLKDFRLDWPREVAWCRGLFSQGQMQLS